MAARRSGIGRVLGAAALAAALLAVSAAGAGGQEDPAATTAEASEPVDAERARVSAVAAEVLAKGWYNEAGAGVDDDRLAEVQLRLATGGSPWGLVTLAEIPAFGTRSFGDELLVEVRAGGSPIKTVVVLTPSEVTAASRTYDDTEVQTALAAAVPAFNTDVVGGFEALYADLTDAPVAPGPEAGTEGGAAGGVRVLAVVGGACAGLAALIVGVAGLRRRSRTLTTAV